MSAVLYYLLTFAEATASVFGIRSVYEQPRYAVLERLNQSVEIRHYEPMVAIEAVIPGKDRDAAAELAFRLLFGYITGANQTGAKIAMTAPVQSAPRSDTRDAASQRIEMTAPVQTFAAFGDLRMRFVLPRSVAASGAPEPMDRRLHLVDVASVTVAVLRYSGVAGAAVRAARTRDLQTALTGTGWRENGEAFDLNYDPPFTIPFLRRNEVAVPVTR